jgi:hypothetical protein
MMHWKEVEKSSCNFFIVLEGLRKSMKNLSWDSQSLGQDLNPGPPKYEG